MNVFKHLPRIAAAAIFAASASTAIVVADATHAGQPASGLLASAPQAADAFVSVGIGINVGNRYPRYAYRGGSWVRFGYGYAAAPGYLNGYYVGYSAPYYGPAYYGWGRPYYGRPYYGRGYYGHPYYGRGYYGRGYGHGYGGYGYRR